METEENFKSIALLIDADNTQLSKVEAVIDEVSLHGRITVKRAYGNWKKDALKNWEDELKRLAIRAEQQFDYVAGKNATDMALVIDTIHLLYKNLYDAFVIVSSDSDYTPLALNLKESGVYVMGVGTKKTPTPFVNSCDEFIFLENIGAVQSDEGKIEPAADEKISRNDKLSEKSGETSAGGKSAKKADSAKSSRNSVSAKSPQKSPVGKKIHSLMKKAWEQYQDGNGYADIGAAGNYIKRAMPEFDTRNYGYSKLTQLVKAFPEQYKVKKTNNNVLYRPL